MFSVQSQWVKRCLSTEDANGFPSGSLGLGAEEYDLEWWPHLERRIGFTLYVALNVMPVSVLTLGFLALIPASILPRIW